MRFLYQVFKTPCTVVPGCPETYGICCCAEENGVQVTVCRVEDISPDRALVEALARKCTDAQLEPKHLPDIAMDALP